MRRNVFLVSALLLSACSSAGKAVVTPNGCDGLDAAQCAAVRALILPDALPPSPGNAHADDEAAAMFGFRVFFSAGFSSGADIRCVTCHSPDMAFRDKGPVSQGVSAGIRNAPTIFNAARMNAVFFWDGRADSLWSQPLFPIESPSEMNFSRLGIVHELSNDPLLGPMYSGVFGALPDDSALPASGAPGDPAFDGLDAATQESVNRVAANLGKALEAYMRKNSTGAAPLDAYLNGDDGAIAADAQRGLALFVTQGCITCHAGPALSDGRFYALDVPLLPGATADPGRSQGAAIAAANIFNAAGPFSDVQGAAPALAPAAVGAFRTPSLRNVMSTAPYGHNGVFAGIDDLLDFHAPKITGAARNDLLAFLTALDGAAPPHPWNDWPSHQ